MKVWESSSIESDWLLWNPWHPWPICWNASRVNRQISSFKPRVMLPNTLNPLPWRIFKLRIFQRLAHYMHGLTRPDVNFALTNQEILNFPLEKYWRSLNFLKDQSRRVGFQLVAQFLAPSLICKNKTGKMWNSKLFVPFLFERGLFLFGLLKLHASIIQNRIFKQPANLESRGEVTTTFWNSTLK